MVSPETVYTITVTNSGGTDTASVTITINDIPPNSVSYSSSFFALTKDSEMTPEEPNNLGGTVTDWSINPQLPNGLSINALNGTISGTPLSVSSAITYTITAENSGGSTAVTITILINDAPPSSINYNPSSSLLTMGTPMGNVTPTYSGGVANSWTITPTLPAGLSFDTSTGEIGGTPTAVSPQTTYTITAINAAYLNEYNEIPDFLLLFRPCDLAMLRGAAYHELEREKNEEVHFS